MPRPNPPRSLPYEAYVAENLRRERERRGMTFESLAMAMKQAGCPIQPSALHKIEKGDPPRRITVNELWALSLCLDIKVQDLCGPPPGPLPNEVWVLVQQAEEILRRITMLEAEIEDHQHHLVVTGEQMQVLLADEPEQRAVLSRHFKEDWADWPELRAVFAQALKSNRAKA